MSFLTALYDACVLYPGPLRGLLMHLAVTDLFRAKWTDDGYETCPKRARIFDGSSSSVLEISGTRTCGTAS